MAQKKENISFETYLPKDVKKLLSSNRKWRIPLKFTNLAGMKFVSEQLNGSDNTHFKM